MHKSLCVSLIFVLWNLKGCCYHICTHKEPFVEVCNKCLHHRDTSLWKHTPWDVKHYKYFQDVHVCYDYSKQVVDIFRTKQNLNTMSELYMSILKALYWRTLVLIESLYCYLDHNNAQVIMCFTHFCLMKFKRMLLPHMHT